VSTESIESTDGWLTRLTIDSVDLFVWNASNTRGGASWTRYAICPRCARLVRPDTVTCGCCGKRRGKRGGAGKAGNGGSKAQKVFGRSLTNHGRTQVD
jgi:hypothetical protein